MAIYSRTELIEWYAARGVRPSSVASLIGAIIGRRESEALGLISAAEAADTLGLTPLNLAARYCLPTLVAALLDLGVDIDHRCSDGSTALGDCLSWFPSNSGIKFEEWEQTARLLLKRGASVAAVDAKGNPAIFVGYILWHWSDPSGFFRPTFGSSVADQLITQCRGMRSAQGKTVLMVAAARGSTHHVQAALKQAVDLEETDEKGQTALFECCSTPRKSVEKAAILIDAGASPDARDSAGETPLFEAARNKDIAVLQRLIEAAADVNATNLEGETPLFVAARHNNPEHAQCLLQAQARTEILDRGGRQAIDLTLRSGNPVLINLLRSK
jgi:ankyrin repeat protein